MATDLLMPAFSPTMEYGTIAKWLVREGDRIAAGDLLAEVETDKATMELEAEDGGVLLSIVVPEGSDDVAVGTVIARIGAERAAADVPGATAAVHAAEATASISGLVEAAPADVPAATMTVANGGLASSSPLALKVAGVRGLDLARIIGSGAGGRVLVSDLLPSPPAALSSPPAIESSAPARPAEAPPADIPFRAIPLSAMRRTNAGRLSEAKREVPHFYLSSDCRIDALLALRAQLNAGLAASGVKISINDFLLKALATALVAVPEANVRFAGDQLYLFDRVDIAMAVAVDGVLVTPVITDAGRRSLSALARQARSLAEAARAGNLAPEAYRGGTASLSNLGMYGIGEMIPIINPPQALILGVGASEERLVPDGAGGAKVSTILRATASFDHRAIDGTTGARLLQAFRTAVESPMVIVV